MKSKTWGILLAVVLFLCVGAAVLMMLPGEKADTAEIWSEGKLLKRVSLAESRSFTVETERGSNVVTVRDGKIAVTEATCPDHYCVRRGFCDSGGSIVCLPNRLEIRFISGGDVDFAVG